MKKQPFELYYINMKYIRDLHNIDNHIMSVSPQINKDKRPFVGIVVICEDKYYCVPLSSPKPKHLNMKNNLDFYRILNNKGKLIGVLNFNNMLPIHSSLISRININIQPDDSSADRAYKNLLRNQLYWCNKNKDIIVAKANKLYHIITQTPEKSRSLTRRCCDFKKLEAVLEKRLADEK